MKSHAAAISWTNTAGGNWSGAVNWSPNQVPGSADDAAITNGGSYTVTLDISVTVNSLVVGGNGGGLQSFTINGPTLSVVVAGTVNESGSLTLDGGLINGAGALTLNGTNAWNGGQFGSGGGVEVTAFGTLYIGTGNDHNMPGLVLNNLGTIIRTGGRIRGGSGGVVNNGGLWVEETDNVFNQDFGGASSQFINTGTYRKTTTGGTSTFESGFQLLNNGLVDAQTGTIEIVDGGGSGDGTWNADTNATCYFDSGYVMNDGSAFTGAGTNALNGGITFTGRFMSENLQWQSGAIGGDGTNVSGSTLYITTGNDHNMPGAVLNNLGTVIRTGGRVRSGGGGVVTNVGLWVEETDNVFNQDYGGTASQFINLGTYRKTTTTGASAFLSGFQLVNAGLVDAESGTIEISDGGGSGNGTWNAAANAVCDFVAGYVFNDGSMFTGAGTNALNGEATFTGGFNSQNLQWQSGYIGGNATNAGGSTLYITTANDHNLPGAVLDNLGTIIRTGGRVRSGGGGVVTNVGLWVDETDNVFNQDYGGTASQFINVGTFRKTTTTGASTFLSGFQLHNGGLVDVETGTLVISDGGGSGNGAWNAAANAACDFVSSYLFNDGSTFTGAGTNALNGGATFTGGFNSQNLQWQSGGIGGNGTNVSGSTFYITTGNDHNLPGAVLNNAGTIIRTGGRVRGGNGGVVTNTGLWLDETDNVFNQDYGGTVSQFVNTGTFRKIGTSGSSAFNQGFDLMNSGLVDAESGTIVIDDGGGINNGTFNAGAGATCDFVSSYTMETGSTFSGAGTNALNGGITFTGGFTSQNLQWQSGSIGGNGTNLGGGTFYITTGNDHNMPGATLNNFGTIVRTGGRVQGGGGSVINNNGLWQDETDNVFDQAYGGPLFPFVNNGTFSKTTTSGTTTFTGGMPVTNNGVLEVLSGNVLFNDAYTQSGATLNFGLSSPTNSGSASVAGNINLNGTLAVTLLNGFVPAVSNSFTVLGFGSDSGTFSNLNLPPLPTNQSWVVTYNPNSVILRVAGYSNATEQITGTVTNNLGQGVTNVTVFANTTNSGGLYITTATDGNGNYTLNVTNGVWTVGLQNLPALGYNPVANQTVTVNNANQVVDFSVQPFTGESWTISTSASPAGSGTTTGGGAVANGAIVTVNAAPITNVFPYVFASWTEGGVVQSTSSSYTFPAVRNRSLVANFILASFTISVSNNPSDAGNVTGGGSYFYGTTNVLTAFPVFGYSFTNWTENGVIVGTNISLTTVVLSNELIVANYSAANLLHVVTTATSPVGLATVTGAGSYTNGQSAQLSAPLAVTNAPDVYAFSEFTLSNTIASTNSTFTKTFSTFDPTNLQYVAVYSVKSILPVVTNVTANFRNPVPATTNLILSVQFDRSMQTNPDPVLTLTNISAGVGLAVPTNGGFWSSTAETNDTFNTPGFVIDTAFNGTNQIFVSGAQDLNGNTMTLTNPASIIVQATPPSAPIASVIASNSTSALVSWAGYAGPGDLSAFRIYIATSNFTSVAGLPILTELGAGSSAYQFTRLSLDTPYFVEIQAVDTAGNASAVAPLEFTLASVIPPPVTVGQTPVGGTSALLSWAGYNTNILGLTGFAVYYAQSNFTSVTGLTPQAALGLGTTSYQVNGLDRTKDYYFAVVGVNYTNGFNPNVTTATWTDPFAGDVAVNTTIGGTSPSVVNINQSITVVSNAVLTITPGTTLLFAPGTKLIVQQGSLVANGTALFPIILDSANDASNHVAAPGDWGGVTLGSGGGSSSLSFVEILYGAGLTVNGCAPAVDAFTANFNTPYGLGLENGATLTTSNALLTGNGIGMQQLDTATLSIQNSVLLNNGTNATATGTSSMTAGMNWWGSASQSVVAGEVQGNVSISPVLNYEPVLTPAIGGSNGVTQVGAQSVNVQLACRTAQSMRLSEDFTFAGVFFEPFSNFTTFPLSAGSGLKHIFAQFRSVTGETNTPVELDVNYISTGPVIQSFSLAEGETLNRPVQVTGSATAALGMRDMEFYVDGALQGTNAGGTFSQYLDIRGLSDAVHSVELLARDTAGNIATLNEDIIVDVTPPLAPVITVPATSIVTNTNTVTIAGTAEPGIGIQVTANGVTVGLTTADTNGNFVVTNAVLSEGVNNVIASASDSTGVTPSAGRQITVETLPPVAVILNQPVYAPGLGVNVSWIFPSSGKLPTSFELFWNPTPFTEPSQAANHSIMLSSTLDTVAGLPNGTEYFGVVGYDAVGNPSPLSGLVSLAVQTTPPSFTIAYGQPSPVGVGPVSIVLTSSEALAGLPSLTMKPFGAVSPILLSVTNIALNTYQTVFNVTSATISGTVSVSVAAQDVAGNVFSGAPSGPALVVDTTPPAATITTVPSTPVQDVGGTNVTVNLVMTKVAGATPTLSFAPPVGSSVPITLAGAGSNWVGTLAVNPAMGSGIGQFSFSGVDTISNVGTIILSGSQLELYDAAQPPPPPAPTNLAAVSLPGGEISLTWNAAANAQVYNVYRETGTDFILPATLIISNITTLGAVDLPPADGLYSYGVTASRFGSESGISNVVTGLSDRTPPPAPTNVAVSLAPSGVQITWQEPSGETPDHYNVYRNGSLIRTVSTITPVVDYPPAGTTSYTVAAVDAIGNSNLSQPALFALAVGPVNNLSVVVQVGQAVMLSWSDSDGGVTGYNLYRNGVKQNASLLLTNTYTDQLPLSDATQYAVTAVNASSAESPQRLVTVSPVTMALELNSNVTTNSNPPTLDYFDTYQVTISNLSSSQALTLVQLQAERTGAGLDPLNITQDITTNIPAQAQIQPVFVAPEATVPTPQAVQITAYEQTDSDGSEVTYQDSFTMPGPVVPGPEILVSADALPLAGGLSPFNVQVNNEGYANMQVIVARGFGAQPGDLYVSVENSLGQEVGRTPFEGTPKGTLFLSDGIGYVNIPAGGSLAFTVPNVLVPEALAGSTNVQFVAVVSNIYNDLEGPNQEIAGPISGRMVSSSLASPPYVGTAQTDKPVYVNGAPILISGQAVSTTTGNPVPNAALNIGFFARGYKWYQPVMTDSNGNYQLTYNPPPGFAGSLSLWAANPEIVDQLNQVTVEMFQFFVTPALGDIEMSKNGSLQFTLQLYNPGDSPLTDFTLSCSAYQQDGTNQTSISTITGTLLSPSGFSVAPNQTLSVNCQLSAAVNAPNTAQVLFTFTSAEGAAATFVGSVTLLPAVPQVTVLSPAVGYLEESINRGTQISGQMTFQNTGFQTLQGITVTPPTNTWISVGAPVSADGLIHLPDLPIGASNALTVVFNPPTNQPLAFYPDSIVLKGTNNANTFSLNVYALVTSSQTGAVQFQVTDNLGSPIQSASIQMKDDLISASEGPFLTDTNGICTVSNLEIGNWNWEAVAPGCSSAVGTFTILADQTISQAAQLDRSLVTINFTVVPVPFTDQYTIQVDETYETFVPLPVLVVTPAEQEFNNLTPGFTATYNATMQNQGLVQLSDVTITGEQTSQASYQPLISYFPVLLPQETVTIPMTFAYYGTNGPSEQSTGSDINDYCNPSPDSLVSSIIGFVTNIQNLVAACQGEAYCPINGDFVKVAQFLGVFGAVYGYLGSFSSAADVAFLIGYTIGCIASIFGAGGGSGGPGVGTPSTGGYTVADTGCFAADTPVLLSDGFSKRIADITTNDVVRTGPLAENQSRVAAVFSRESSEVCDIELSTVSNAKLPGVWVSEEHLFWVDGKGWTPAGALKKGDWLFNSKGWRVQVVANKPLKSTMKVYTFKLWNDDAFYADDVQVHDLCGKYAATSGGFKPVGAFTPVKQEVSR